MEIKTLEKRIDVTMQAWRLRVQTRMMVLGALLVFPALIQTIWRAVINPNEWPLSLVLLLMYMGVLVLIFTKKVPVRVRGWVFILLLYVVGFVAMARGGLWGDGRIYLVLLPVFGILLINVGVGKYLVALSLAIYILFGFLNHIGLLGQWMISHVSPAPTEIWIYDGLIFTALMVIAAIVLIDFHNLLMNALRSEHENADHLRQAHDLLDEVNLELEEKVLLRTSELAKANERLHQLVNHDPLTGLPNRDLFFNKLNAAIIQAQRHESELGVLFIDLDNFKSINDSFGHHQGDLFLVKIAECLQKNVRETDTVARLSGDEFAIIIEDLSSAADASSVVNKLISALFSPINLNNEEVELTASIGISIFPRDGRSADTLLRRADTAMYRIKHTTKGDYCFYSD